MKRELRRDLMAAFGHISWASFRELLTEATFPHEVRMTWKCIAKGKARTGNGCIVDNGLDEDTTITGHYVAEEFSYIRFVTSDLIYRFQNPADMKAELKEWDATQMTDIEEGDTFILEPMGKARSLGYSTRRRQAIKDGTWIVEPRGPNPNMRRQPKHHFRPF